MSTFPTSPRTPATSAPTSRSLAWVDGRVLPATEATVPLLDDGFLRGDAVFDAMLVRAGRTHARDAHLDRLRRSGRAMGIRVPRLARTITDLLVAWGERDGALKLVVTRAGTVRGLISAPQHPDPLSLALVDAPWRTALSGIKTLSYAANQWAQRRAALLHADDALVVDGGVVHELPSGAVCVVAGGAVRTPDPATTPILDSITVRELARVADVTHQTLHLDDVLTADELFVVSATRPVVAVSDLVAGPGIEATDRELVTPGPLTADLRDAFAAHVARTLDPMP